MEGRFQERGWTPTVLSSGRAYRWPYVLMLFVCGLVLPVGGAMAQTPARSNKNVRTWTWAKDVVQPDVNSISRLQRPQRSYQQISRQLLAEARRAAESGELQAAIELARRADALVTIARQTSLTVWDSAEQSPASFLRQLELVHRQRLREAEIPRRQVNERPGRVSLSQGNPPAPRRWRSNPFSTSGPTRGPAHGDEPALENWTAVGSEPVGKETAVAENRRIVDGEAKSDDVRERASSDRAGVATDSAATSVVPSGEKKNETRPDGIAHGNSPSPTVPATPLVHDRVVQIAPSANTPQRSMWTDALVQLFSTAAGLILGIVLLVAVRAFIKRQYGADFGFIFRVEHVNAGGAMWYAPDESGILPFPTPKMDSGRDGAGAVLNDLPEGFVSDELSPYEQELRAAEEAEKEMMKFVFEKNLELRDELDRIAA